MAIGTELACNLIQAKLRTLAPAYLQEAPDMADYRTALDDAICPYAMTWPGQGRWYQKGGGYKVDERTLELFVFVESLAQKDIPARTVQGTRLLDAIVNMFIVPGNIPLDNGTLSGYQITLESKMDSPHSDTGMLAGLPFTGINKWAGFNMHLNVRIMWTI